MSDQQKYFTEVALLQATNGVWLIKPAEFERIEMVPREVRNLMEECHIYFVCQRPRIRVSTASYREEKGIRIILNVTSAVDTTTSLGTLIPNEKLSPEVTSVNIMENGAYFALSDGKKDLTPRIPPDFLIPLVRKRHPELAKLEVLYIGQSYDCIGERSIIDRLKSHNTLQKVLSEQSHNSWWMEPLIILFSYDQPQLIAKMDGHGEPQIIGDEDRERFKSIVDDPLSNAQLVTIAEASLIKYFKPHYNVHFKESYPTSKMEHLRDAYRLDYNAIVTEIDTEDIFMSTFTECQEPREHHIVQFELHDRSERLSFFELSKQIEGLG